MNITLDVAQKECARYFNNYAKCVERFPQTWHMDCTVHKTKLARCAETDPIVVEIKEKCTDEYRWYEICANKHPTNLENCSQQFDVFDSCAVKISDKTKKTKAKNTDDS